MEVEGRSEEDLYRLVIFEIFKMMGPNNWLRDWLQLRRRYLDRSRD